MRSERTLLAFTTPTGLESIPAVDEAPVAHAPPLTDQPALRQLDRAALAADARVRRAADNRRHNPELTLAYRRERTSSIEAYGGSVTLGIRMRWPRTRATS
jgi:hypothetical protein